MPLNQETNGQGLARGGAPRQDSTKVAVKQENLPTNGQRSGGHSNDRDLANAASNGQKLRAVGDEQAQENRQEQLTLPPPICEPEPTQEIEDGADEEPEDPAMAAERAIHHGFMNQALDMVRRILMSLSIFKLFVPVDPMRLPTALNAFEHSTCLDISPSPLLNDVAFHSLAAAFHLCTPHYTTSCRTLFLVVPSSSQRMIFILG